MVGMERIPQWLKSYQESSTEKAEQVEREKLLKAAEREKRKGGGENRREESVGAKAVVAGAGVAGEAEEDPAAKGVSRKRKAAVPLRSDDDGAELYREAPPPVSKRAQRKS